jgi:hypothetical protein
MAPPLDPGPPSPWVSGGVVAPSIRTAPPGRPVSPWMSPSGHDRGVTQPPAGCSDPRRWLDAYQIAAGHRPDGAEVCACGRPLPCTAAERALTVMDETMYEVRQTLRVQQEAIVRARAIAAANTQDLSTIDVPTQRRAAPVGARFPRDQSGDLPTIDVPAQRSTGPVGARFRRDPGSPRQRA